MPIWCIAVPIFTLFFVVYPAIVGMPHNEGEPALTAVAERVPVQDAIQETCPPLDHCAGVVVEQALPRLPLPPFLLLALVVLVLAMRWRDRTRAVIRDWWPPPNRRRALLQVFLM